MILRGCIIVTSTVGGGAKWNFTAACFCSEFEPDAASTRCPFLVAVLNAMVRGMEQS